MKLMILLLGFCFIREAQSLAQTNPVVASIDPGIRERGSLVAGSRAPSAITDDIMTRDGTIYKKIRIERIDPSGLTVTHALPGGGMGLAKIAFARLPHEMQEKYGYDPKIAAKFESEESQAEADWAARMAADEQAAKITIIERERREAEAERESAQLAEDQRKLKAEELAAQAAMFQATNPPAANNTGGRHRH